MSDLPIESLYMHVPFCAQKCHYCAFYSESSKGEVVDAYVKALLVEIQMAAARIKPRTIFFGGGTPSILNLNQWSKILELMNNLGLNKADEWTVECNPATISLDKARLLRDGGVNRISMGVQSLDPNLLERLGRVHSRDMVFRSYDILRKAGFSNINLDFMFAIPGQDLAIWNKTLTEAISMEPEHMSCYEVIYEEDTALFHQLQAGEFDIDESLACEMYEALIDAVTEAGYSQYEIANFARRETGSLDAGGIPELSCKHNVNYWAGGQFLGLGPSASEYVNGVRTKNISNTQFYCEKLQNGMRPVESEDRLTSLGRAGELAGLGMRMNRGLNAVAFEEMTGFSLADEWSKEIGQLSELAYAGWTGDRFHLTRAGLRYADWAAELFLRIE